ncbi:hypothetical protein [Roseiconus lacunae]|uniref:Uncharacterized protein n=1 Tax=Roseiconus lacunae TaxID=2605694 RepID=A0ABT7PIA9_9BACT|nr:hypothetical protein [Roseiconus lacunae]MDM4015986.1 hypothetical protein [Roseiconus lacunae]
MIAAPLLADLTPAASQVIAAVGCATVFYLAGYAHGSSVAIRTEFEKITQYQHDDRDKPPAEDPPAE